MTIVYKEDMDKVASLTIEFFSEDILSGKIIYTHWSDEVWFIVSGIWCKLCDKEQFIPYVFGSNDTIRSQIRINYSDFITILNVDVEWKEKE